MKIKYPFEIEILTKYMDFSRVKKFVIGFDLLKKNSETIEKMVEKMENLEEIISNTRNEMSYNESLYEKIIFKCKKIRKIFLRDFLISPSLFQIMLEKNVFLSQIYVNMNNIFLLSVLANSSGAKRIEKIELKDSIYYSQNVDKKKKLLKKFFINSGPILKRLVIDPSFLDEELLSLIASYNTQLKYLTFKSYSRRTTSLSYSFIQTFFKSFDIPLKIVGNIFFFFLN